MTTASRKTSTPDTPRTARLNAAFALLLGLATACGAGAAEPPHTAQPGLSSCIPAVSTTASASGRVVPFFASTSHVPGRQGFVRVVNRSAEAGTVSIAAFDDHGGSYGPLTLSLDTNAAAHFNADDLERGNPAKGLSGCTGAGRGDWRLELASQLDIAVFSYNRTGDGFVAPVTGAVPWGDGGFRIATFNPGSNQDQQSLLRLVNFADTDATVTIGGTDDAGTPGRGPVTVHVPAGGARTYSASDLESGGATGLDGSLGDGAGKWRLAVRSDRAVTAMNLMSSPTGHLANLSRTPRRDTGPIHVVPLFPSASDPLGRQGFVRVINHTDAAGEVTIRAFDDTGREYDALALSLGANEAVHFNADDLETGNPHKALAGSTGAGAGDWRLSLTSDLEIDVLPYVRTPDGFVTAMHGTVPREGDAYPIATFNPGANVDQASRLRLVNTGAETAQVTVTGIDDRGERSSGAVSVALPAGAARTLTALQLEGGGDGFEGAIGAGAGKWRLVLESEQPIVAMNLLANPTGHLANLTTGPAGALTFTVDFHRGTQGFVADFADYRSDLRENFELTSDYRPLASPLDPRSALFLSGFNQSADLFMFFKGRIAGLVPGARYAVAASAEIATDTRTGCFGIGGAPGESVWIKAGASAVEPVPVLKGSILRMNIDIGNQSAGGEHAVVLGDIANSRPCGQPRRWERKAFPSRSLPAPLVAPADGRAWLLFGSDSGFEGRTEIYFTRVSITLTPARAPTRPRFAGPGSASGRAARQSNEHGTRDSPHPLAPRPFVCPSGALADNKLNLCYD